MPGTATSQGQEAEVPPARAAGHETFLRNMGALWRSDPVLALRVDVVHDQERIPLEATRNGSWTAQMATPDGRSVYLHSRYDPESEAARLIGAIPIEDKFCFVVSGMGLGYHLLALNRRLKGDSIIVCIEPSLALISTALTCVDLSELIASRRLIILTDHNKARLHERLQPFNALIMLGAQFVKHPPSARVAERAHNAVTQVIAEFVTYTRMNLMTLVANSKITCRNIAMNLPTYVTTPPIDVLRNRFAGDPAVVISAGPSLSRCLDGLRKLKGRALLVAVQTAVKPLMHHAVVPDFVTSLDFHEMSRKFFEGVAGLENTHLVAEPKATWHVVDHYPGPVSLLDNSWARLVVGEELGARGGLKAGATVSHLAFYLAVYMGCDPIIFVGQDLAFAGHTFYVPGVEIHESWRGELSRFNTIEQKEWDRIVRNRPILRRVQSVDGRELYTDELLFTYLEQFEKDIADVSCRVVNAGRIGAKIRGTIDMTLEEAAEQFCHRTIDPRRFDYRTQTRWRDGCRVEAARRALEQRLEELDRAAALCEELLELLAELEALTHDAVRFNRRLIRVDELRTKVQHESRAYQIINHATQLAEFKRFSADRRLSAGGLDDAERAKRQIARDTEFITAVRDGAREVSEILREALARVVGGMESA